MSETNPEKPPADKLAEVPIGNDRDMVVGGCGAQRCGCRLCSEARQQNLERGNGGFPF